MVIQEKDHSYYQIEGVSIASTADSRAVSVITVVFYTYPYSAVFDGWFAFLS